MGQVFEIPKTIGTNHIYRKSFHPSANTYLFLIDCNPVCCGEPFVVLDVIDAIFQVTVSLGKINLQQTS